MTEWILYGIRPNISTSTGSVITDNAIVLLNAGFLCKEDAMVYWRFREHAGCHHLFLAQHGPGFHGHSGKKNNRTTK